MIPQMQDIPELDSSIKQVLNDSLRSLERSREKKVDSL